MVKYEENSSYPFNSIARITIKIFYIRTKFVIKLKQIHINAVIIRTLHYQTSYITT